jgi:hypothetical protein
LPCSILGSDTIISRTHQLYTGEDIHGYKAIDESLKEEYIASKKDFSVVDYLAVRNGHCISYGFEVLPPTAIRYMKLKPSVTMEPVFFSKLLNFYNGRYNCQIFGTHHVLGNNCVSNLQLGHTNELVKTVVSNKIMKFNTLNLFGEKYKSTKSNSSNTRGSYIRAIYRTEEEEEEIDVYHTVSKFGEMRPAQIMFFFRHKVDVLSKDDKLENITHTFAYVR